MNVVPTDVDNSYTLHAIIMHSKLEETWGRDYKILRKPYGNHFGPSTAT
jgi:hypothetical protein